MPHGLGKGDRNVVEVDSGATAHHGSATDLQLQRHAAADITSQVGVPGEGLPAGGWEYRRAGIDLSGRSATAELREQLDQHNATQQDPAWPALLEAPTRIDKTAEDPQTPEDEYIYWPN